MGGGTTKKPKFISKSHYFYPNNSQDISATQDTASPKELISKHNHSNLSIEDEAAANICKDDATVRIDQGPRSPQAARGKGSRTIKSQNVRVRPNKRYHHIERINQMDLARKEQSQSVDLCIVNQSMANT